MSLRKKLRKLLRNPRLFFKDFLVKRSKRFALQRQSPVLLTSGTSFSIVSAVYNVEKYLDDFFDCLIKQTLDFENHFEVIMVDDGSTDRSAQIIEMWQRRYPNNIKYIYQTNEGQASARNTGIKAVTHQWVSFADPDDFLDKDYFSNISRMIQAHDKDISMIACNVVYYLESNKSYRNDHPLRHKFAQGNRVVDPFNERNAIQLSSSSTIFRSAEIVRNQIQFDKRMRPNFEDGKFILDFLLVAAKPKIGFAADATYYYRKRGDGTSTLDTAFLNKDRYLVPPKLGYLAALKDYAERHKKIPAFVQWTVLYEATWLLKALINQSTVTNLLSEKERRQFLDTFRDIFQYISDDHIMSFNLAGAWFYHKTAMLSLFKQKNASHQIVYIERVDADRKLICLRYFCHKEQKEEVYIDQKLVTPSYEKTKGHTLFDEPILQERNLWIPVNGLWQDVRIFIDGKPTKLSLKGEQNVLFDLDKIFKKFKKPAVDPKLLNWHDRALRWLAQRKPIVSYFGNSWLLMDRDTQADDNAEHFYQYIKTSKPNINTFFVLQKKSHDWKRLKKKGFRLLPFGGIRHKLALLTCKNVISSHADLYVFGYLPTNKFGDMINYKTTFLQHGMTMQNISKWINGKNLDCLISCAGMEHKAFIEAGNEYNYGQREVKLGGFARHDELLRRNSETVPSKTILIMPTWRASLVGKQKGKSNRRALNPDFMQSLYAQRWSSLLQSEKLKTLVEKYGYRVVFFPHANTQPYMKQFKVPKHIECISHSHVKIQDLFVNSDIMITDYSSVACEMAYLKKAVLYYQFDAEEFLGGAHMLRKGYFDFTNHGFGPVENEESKLIKRLDEVCKNAGRPTKLYESRMKHFFPHRDGKNCERIFEAITALHNSTAHHRLPAAQAESQAEKSFRSPLGSQVVS